jgi:hypothetical protein
MNAKQARQLREPQKVNFQGQLHNGTKRKGSGPRRKKVTGGWGKLRNKNLHRNE